MLFHQERLHLIRHGVGYLILDVTKERVKRRQNVTKAFCSPRQKYKESFIQLSSQTRIFIFFHQEDFFCVEKFSTKEYFVDRIPYPPSPKRKGTDTTPPCHWACSSTAVPIPENKNIGVLGAPAKTCVSVYYLLL